MTTGRDVDGRSPAEPVLISSLILSTAYAINFSAPIPLAMGKGTVVTVDGVEHVGKVTGKLRGQNALASVKIKNDAGKLSFTADQVSRVSISPSSLTELAGTVRGLSSVREAQNTTFNNQIVYEQITMPDGDVILLQLINPGFDSMLKVYADPSLLARESAGVSVGGLKLTGGIPSTLYVKPSQGEDGLRRIERPNYGNLAAELFSGVCPGYVLGETDPDYLNMPDHVLGVHEQCGAGRDEEAPAADAPAVEAPAVEAPAVEAPAVEAPVPAPIAP
jgi:hypothetical protein